MKSVNKLALPFVAILCSATLFSCEKEEISPSNDREVIYLQRDGEIDPPPSEDEYVTPPDTTTGRR